MATLLAEAYNTRFEDAALVVAPPAKPRTPPAAAVDPARRTRVCVRGLARLRDGLSRRGPLWRRLSVRKGRGAQPVAARGASAD